MRSLQQQARRAGFLCLILALVAPLIGARIIDEKPRQRRMLSGLSSYHDAAFRVDR